MTQPDATWWVRARRAQKMLAAQFLGQPDIRMVDIGEDPEGQGGTLVLRVHVRRPEALDVQVPEEVEGIPVRVVRGDYRPEGKS